MDVDVKVYSEDGFKAQCFTMDVLFGGKGCQFRFLAPSATITSQESPIDAGFTQIKFIGTGFGTDTSLVQLIIEGVEAPIVSLSDTEALFKLTTARNTSSSDYTLYFVDGNPADLPSSLAFSPGLISISLNVGSFAGTVTRVTGVGFGLDTQDVNLYSMGTSDTLCSDVTVTGYGEFICTVKVETENAADAVVKLAISSSNFDCVNDVATLCSLEIVEATSLTLTDWTFSLEIYLSMT